MRLVTYGGVAGSLSASTGHTALVPPCRHPDDGHRGPVFTQLAHPMALQGSHRPKQPYPKQTRNLVCTSGDFTSELLAFDRYLYLHYSDLFTSHAADIRPNVTATF